MSEIYNELSEREKILIEENSILEAELNRALHLLAKFYKPQTEGRRKKLRNWLDRKVDISQEEFDDEITSIREQGRGWAPDYITPIENSQKASEYLILHSGEPIDFDNFHKKFQIRMDKGGNLFPYDTLNWHTYLRLKHKGYEYKLFYIDTLYGECPKGIRYILVDKEDKMVWGNTSEKEHRSFNNEHFFYRGAYYNSNFEIVKDKTDDNKKI